SDAARSLAPCAAVIVVRRGHRRDDNQLGCRPRALTPARARVPSSSAKLAAERANVGHQCIRLLHCREMTASRHGGPVPQVVLTLDRAAGYLHHLAREHGDSGRYIDELGPHRNGWIRAMLGVVMH